ncbi:acyltransferase family protein [Desulfovibrio sp. UCD-KL4C]|uniref:acyltransferase family protein n=1 Tax=Desulfovibrio sp. UCD-KL4C TaxID=2578120 RepID=UPI0025C28197|nr:acyltransferase family protein [Desulfovibrio sp. UCD-KL4C]
MNSIPYRRDIDGLRAIAVVLVILAHAQYHFFEGGFIGVDVFFVISGYLITSIVLSEIDRGIFSFKNFYCRRIRRILPAFLFMLVGVALVSYYILFPQKFISFTESLFASITSWVNYFLCRFFEGYWGGYSKEFPLTHIWSLSVEEQFYFLWPSILFIAYKFIPKKIHVWCLILALSFLICLSQLLTFSPEFAFYMIPARSFELFMGCAVALIFREPICIQVFKKNLCPLLSIVGLLLIFIPAVVYKENLLYPGLNALWPCLGASIIVLPKANGFCLVKKILSWDPIVGIGKISYSLYLWHWPPLAFTMYAGYSVEKYRLLLILLSFCLSVFSYFFVERPFRRSEMSFLKLICLLLIIPALISFALFYFSKINNGFIERFPLPLREKIVAVESSSTKIFLGAQKGKNSPSDSHIVNDKTIWGNDHSGVVNALLIGDSHAMALRPFVEIISNGLNIKGLQTTKDSTPYLVNVDFYDIGANKKFVSRKDKKEMIKYWSHLILNPNIKYVFMAGFYYSRIFKGPQSMRYKGALLSSNIVEQNKKSFLLGLTDSIDFIIKNHKIPVIFKDIPFTVVDMSANEVKNEYFGTSLKTEIPYADVINRHEYEDKVIDELAVRFPSLIVIDPKLILCPPVPDGNLSTLLDGIPLYHDSNHLNYYGAIKLAHKWIKKYGNPLIAPIAVHGANRL